MGDPGSQSMAAARQFAALPELVTCVAHQAFYSRQCWTLKNMRLVNKIFHDAATPYRFRELRIWETIAETRSKGGLNPLRGHVRTAIIEAYTGLAHEEELLQEIISQMPRLESFQYSGVPLTHPILHTLTKSCPRLTLLELRGSMSGQAPGLPSDPTPLVHYPGPDFEGFCGLRELTLHGMLHDNHAWWIPQLVRLLKHSPGLKNLGLGFIFPGIERDVYTRKVTESLYFLDRLCDLYGSEGCPPLRLESLELLKGLIPYKVSSLKKLTDLTYLRHVYINNYSTSMFPLPLRPEPMALEAFAPPHAPNLRYFSIDSYTKVIHEHLCAIQDPSFTRKLAISCRLRPHKSGLDLADLLRPSPDHPSLPLKVRMIDLQLRRELVYGPSSDQIKISAEQVLEDLVSTNADSLEGLAVEIPAVKPKPDDLDANPHLRLLERALARLPQLTQLSVSGLGVENAVGQRLALAAPRLRFINSASRFWRVWRNDDGTVKLEIVKTREADRIELWKRSVFNLTPLSFTLWLL